MNLSDCETEILKGAIPYLKGCPVIQKVLGGEYSKTAPPKNRIELDAYTKEAILWAILVPIARCFFMGRHNTFCATVGIEEELASYMKPFLELRFDLGCVAKLS